MKNRHVIILIVALLSALPLWAAQSEQKETVPKYNPKTEATFKGTIIEVKDRQCPVSGGMGSHLSLKLTDGSTIEVHLASTKFVKAYELVFEKGDQVEVIGSKVQFEGVDTIFAREVHRGQDTFLFRDKEGKPIW
jgi:DNA/RNA endonuclease YhcR with UshA esterase domain